MQTPKDLARQAAAMMIQYSFDPKYLELVIGSEDVDIKEVEAECNAIISDCANSISKPDIKSSSDLDYAIISDYIKK